MKIGKSTPFFLICKQRLPPPPSLEESSISNCNGGSIHHFISIDGVFYRWRKTPYRRRRPLSSPLINFFSITINLIYIFLTFYVLIFIFYENGHVAAYHWIKKEKNCFEFSSTWHFCIGLSHNQWWWDWLMQFFFS